MGRLNRSVLIRAILVGLSVGVLAFMGTDAVTADGSVDATVGAGVSGLAAIAAAAGAVWRAVRPIVTADADGDSRPAIVDADDHNPEVQ